MNSKNLLHALSASACALALVACGSSDSSSDSNLSAAANAAKQALLGTWTGACQDLSSGNNSTSSQQSIAYTTTQITISEATFNDNGSCSGTADFTAATRASYVVGNANATSTNVGGFPIDLTLPSGSVLLSIFRIEQNNTVLLVGNGDGPKDGDGRESTLNPAPFMKDGAAAPSATPTPTATPTDDGRAAAQESLQGAWFRACQVGEGDGTTLRDRIAFDGAQVNFNRDVYSDSSDCSTSPDLAQSFSQTGNFSVGDAVTTSGGMTARAIDLDFGSDFQLLSIFLVDQNGTRLLTGDEEGPKDENGRESQLNFDMPYTAGTPPVAVTSSCDNDSDGGFACANQLGTVGFDNQRIEDNLDVPFGDAADYFAFEIEGADDLFGTTLIINARDPSGGSFQPVCTLFENDEGTPREITSGCAIRQGRARNGSYFFVVQGADQQSSGNYQIDYLRE